MTKTTKTKQIALMSIAGLMGSIGVGGMVVAVPSHAQVALPQDVTPSNGLSLEPPVQDPAALPRTTPDAAGDRYLQSIAGIGRLFKRTDDVASLVTSVNLVMTDRTRRIMALRQLLKLGFSKEDIETALPLLQRLRDIKTPPPTDPEKAMDEEYQALLKAKPTEPLPPSSTEKIMDAARYYRTEQTKIWTEMTQRLGKSKSDGLDDLTGYSKGSFFSMTWTPRLALSSSYSVNYYPTSKPSPTQKPGDARLETVPPPKAEKPTVVSPANSAKDVRVMFSSTTVRISLNELIDLMQEKLKAMSGK